MLVKQIDILNLVTKITSLKYNLRKLLHVQILLQVFTKTIIILISNKEPEILYTQSNIYINSVLNVLYLTIVK